MLAHDEGVFLAGPRIDGSSSHPRGNITLYQSTDLGSNWRTVAMLHEGHGEGYSSMINLPGGAVGIVYVAEPSILFQARSIAAKSDDDEIQMPSAPITAAELQAKVVAAIASHQPTVDVPGGAYLFNTSGGTDFLILGASNLRIRALAPVTLWFAGSAGVNLTDSTDVQLVGSSNTAFAGPAWTLDYDPPPTKQELAGSTLNLLNCTRVLAEDVTIRAAPYMAVTAWNGGGAHVFRRLTFGPPKPGAYRGLVGLRDATHFSDQRIGPTIVDSVIGYTGDDFFVSTHNLCTLCLLTVAFVSCSSSDRSDWVECSYDAPARAVLRHRHNLPGHQPPPLRAATQHCLRDQQRPRDRRPGRPLQLLQLAAA